MEILLSALRKWWKLLIVAVLISGAVAYLVSRKFGRESATATASMLYAGLPSTLSTSISETIGPGTGAEMLISMPVLERLRERRNLSVPSSVLSRLIQARVGRNSALMKVTISWGDATESVAILNDLLDVFIDEMANQRKAVLQGYVEHADVSVLKQKMEVDDVRRQRDAFTQEQTRQLEGGRSPNDRYRAAFDEAIRAAQTIEEKKTALAGMEDQITALDQERAAIVEERRKLVVARKQSIVDKLNAALSVSRDRYARHTVYYKAAGVLQEELARLNSRTKHDQDFEKWQSDLTSLVDGSTQAMQGADREILLQTRQQLVDYVSAELTSLDGKLRQFAGKRQQLQLSMLPLKNEIALVEKRRTDSETEAEALSGQAAHSSTSQVNEVDQKLNEVQDLLHIVTLQRDSLRLLQESRINEWSVSVPAMPETTMLSSNRRKVFLMSFALVSLALCAPFFLVEWHAQRDPPQVTFARSLHLPVLARQQPQRSLPQPRAFQIGHAGDESQREAMRMLTLRIQQTCHRSGSVILFSSLDPAVSAAPTIASVAQCLADREERVLLVDAVSPDRSLLPILNLFFGGTAVAEPMTKSAGVSAVGVDDPPGLAEYFSNECKSTCDLIRPTNCPGVDLIASGCTAFYREAMASSTLTELLNTCRQNYTMILIHGPVATWAADLQMLAARADGVVLTASKQVGRDPQVREVVEDLLSLGAPIIGIVA